MAGYKCNVTGSTSSKKVAPAQVAAYCEDDSIKCVKGAKQMVAFNRKIFDPLVVFSFFIPLTESSRKNRKQCSSTQRQNTNVQHSMGMEIRCVFIPNASSLVK